MGRTMARFSRGGLGLGLVACGYEKPVLQYCSVVAKDNVDPFTHIQHLCWVCSSCWSCVLGTSFGVEGGISVGNGAFLLGCLCRTKMVS